MSKWGNQSPERDWGQRQGPGLYTTSIPHPQVPRSCFLSMSLVSTELIPLSAGMVPLLQRSHSIEEGLK